jgi:hypothetical protein
VKIDILHCFWGTVTWRLDRKVQEDDLIDSCNAMRRLAWAEQLGRFQFRILTISKCDVWP